MTTIKPKYTSTFSPRLRIRDTNFGVTPNKRRNHFFAYRWSTAVNFWSTFDVHRATHPELRLIIFVVLLVVGNFGLR